MSPRTSSEEVGLTAAGSRRRPHIQGLRAVAVIAVVLFHAGLGTPGGFTGVDIFFVISGFVIARMLWRELDETGRIDLPRFYARRIKRLLPAFALMTGVVALAGVAVTPFEAQVLEGRTGLWSSIFAANAFLYRLPNGYFDLDTGLDPFVHTWTLAVEEQFYVLFPTLLFLVWLLRRSWRAGAAAVAAGTAVSFILCIWLSKGHALRGLTSPQTFDFYSSPTRAWQFGAGALLALIPGVSRLPREVRGTLGLAGALLVGASLFALHDAPGYPGWSALIPTAGALALLASDGSLIGRLLSLRPAVRIGDLSYSWYLWHWPFIAGAVALWPGVRVAGPIAAVASLAPAYGSYRWLEQPVRYAPRLHGRRVLALAAACIAVSGVASLALIGANHVLQHDGTLTAWSSARALHLDATSGCVTGRVPTDASLARCTWPARGARHGEIALVGDSNAGHFSEPVVVGGVSVGYDVTLATTAGCPFTGLSVGGTPGINQANCSAFNRVLLAELLRRRPSLVIIASRTDGYLRDGTYALGYRGTVTRAPSRKAEFWTEGLRDVLVKLGQRGIPVVLIHPVPDFRQRPDACAVVRALLDSCPASVARAGIDRRLSPSRAAEAAALKDIPGASALDLMRELCDAHRCFLVRGRTLLYRDREHLSVAGARMLTDQFKRLISSRAAPRPLYRLPG